MYDKIEEFLFDIIGLLLPGLIAILLFISLPLIVFPVNEIEKMYNNNMLVLSNLIKFYDSNKVLCIVAILIVAYILGHTIKVFSKYPYSFFKVIFDDGLNRLLPFFISSIYKFFRNLGGPDKKNLVKPDDGTSPENNPGSIEFSSIEYILRREYRKEWTKNNPTKTAWISFLDFISKLYDFLCYILKSIFTFDAPNYYKENEKLIEDVVMKINKRFNTDFPKEWYSFYKISNVIMEQEKLKSLSFRFLAKYNFYRSLSFVFLLNFLYITYFFKANASGNETEIYTQILVINFFLWFTFHEKFKRYWTLCGNESLMSLFYFINKTEDKGNDIEIKKEKANGEE